MVRSSDSHRRSIRQRWRRRVEAWGREQTADFTLDLVLEGGLSPGMAGDPDAIDQERIRLPYRDVRAAYVGRLEIFVPPVAALATLLGLAVWGVWWTVDHVIGQWSRSRGEFPDRAGQVARAVAEDIASTSALWQVLALLAVAVAVSAGVLFWTRSRQVPVLEERSIEPLRRIARPLIIAEINRVVNSVDVTRLAVTTSPALGDVLTPSAFVPRLEGTRLDLLEDRLGARVLGLSGPRGAGKSALLQHISRDRRRSGLAVVVAAPVRYSAREFLLLLYGELCSAVLTATSAPSRAVRTLLSVIRTVLGATALVCAWLTLVNLLRTAEDLRRALPNVDAFATAVERNGLVYTGAPPALTAFLALTSLGALAVADYATGSANARHGAAGRQLHRLARHDLGRIRYLMTRSATGGGQWSLFGLQISMGRTAQRAEQAPTLPELTAAYAAFTAAVTAWSRAGRRWRPLVCIDEADRIADPSEAAAFLSDVKSVIAVPGCVFMVALADNAEGGGIAEVLSSQLTAATFDHVVTVGPFRLAESLGMLTTQVPGISDLTVVVSHTLGRGLPRAVIHEFRGLLMRSWEARERDVLVLGRAAAAEHTAELLCRAAQPPDLTPTGDREFPDDDATPAMGDVRAAWDAVTSRPGLADVLRRLPRGPSSLPVLADVLYLRTVADLLDSAWGELAREAAVARTQADGFVKDGRRFSELAGEAPLRVDLLVAAGRRPPRQAIDDLLALRESWHLESAAGPEQCP